jgi:hypothetical protein
MPAQVYSQPNVRRRDPPFAPSDGAATRRAPTRVARRRAIRRDSERTLLGSIAGRAFAAVLVGALFLGWRDSEDGYLAPDTGLGYWLGIAGATLMLLLLLYPLRKRMRSLRGLGSVSGWFRLHMVLGLVGPALILLHCNFKLGALNSNVALVAMLMVAASGLVGRHLYRRIHLGLYGRRARIDDLLDEIRRLKDFIEHDRALPGSILGKLDAHAARALAGHGGLAASVLALLDQVLRSPGRRLMDEADRYIAAEGKRRAWSWRTRRRRARELRWLLREYVAAVNKAAVFAVYERLFALWHVLHLPLFILLIVAAIVHIVGVHLY